MKNYEIRVSERVRSYIAVRSQNLTPARLAHLINSLERKHKSNLSVCRINSLWLQGAVSFSFQTPSKVRHFDDQPSYFTKMTKIPILTVALSPLIQAIEQYNARGTFVIWSSVTKMENGEEYRTKGLDTEPPTHPPTRSPRLTIWTVLGVHHGNPSPGNASSRNTTHHP